MMIVRKRRQGLDDGMEEMNLRVLIPPRWFPLLREFSASVHSLERCRLRDALCLRDGRVNVGDGKCQSLRLLNYTYVMDVCKQICLWSTAAFE